MREGRLSNPYKGNDRRHTSRPKELHILEWPMLALDWSWCPKAIAIIRTWMVVSTSRIVTWSWITIHNTCERMWSNDATNQRARCSKDAMIARQCYFRCPHQMLIRQRLKEWKNNDPDRWIIQRHLVETESRPSHIDLPMINKITRLRQ